MSVRGCVTDRRARGAWSGVEAALGPVDIIVNVVGGFRGEFEQVAVTEPAGRQKSGVHLLLGEWIAQKSLQCGQSGLRVRPLVRSSRCRSL